MGIIDGLANVVTLGGHKQLQTAQSDYQQAYQAYVSTLHEAEGLQAELMKQYGRLGEITRDAMRVLKKACAVLGRAETDRRTYRHQPTAHTFTR